MKPTVWNTVRRGVYADSVTLMRLSRDVEALPGVARAAVMIGTPANLALLRDAGLLGVEGERATSRDLVLAVVTDEAAAVDRVVAALDGGLHARPPAAVPGERRARTLDTALRLLPRARLALISVPGPYAGAEALKALMRDLHVMVFSDNVPVETEIELKRVARERKLLLLGPDCGTAILDGVPLGFANAVDRGRIGLVAASGTGLQEVSCLVAAAGEGVSQAIGVGGRDLTDAVGGAMTEMALDRLAGDPATTVIVVIGKPPGPATARQITARLQDIGKPSVACWSGGTMTLEDAALTAVALARGERFAPVDFTAPKHEIERVVEDAMKRAARGQRFVRGLYTGGTLAWEALGLLRARLSDVSTSLTGDGEGHRVVDLGDDRFTVGRPHPMIDGTVRRQEIARAAADPATAVLLLDVVLGYGAHPDPAGELLPALQAARRDAERANRSLAVVASVCGTDGDPQGRRGQVAALRAAGVTVMPSNAQAGRLAALVAARLAERA